MVLVDTSVWVDHFKSRNEQLVALLHAGLVACHSFVVLELACGTPPDRQEIIERLGDLQSIQQVTDEELLGFILINKLYGRGCGVVDLALLAAVKIQPQTSIWTFNKRLNALAEEFGCAYDCGHVSN